MFQLALPAGGSRYLPVRRFRFRRRSHIGKKDHHQPPQRLRSLDPLDRQIHELLPAVGRDIESPDRHGAFLLEGFVESAGQFVSQALAGHGKNVPVGFAGRRFQVFAGPATDVEDVALVVDQDGRRGVMLQDQVIRQ